VPKNHRVGYDSKLGARCNRWKIVPDTSIHNDLMDIDPQLDEWEDIFEEKLGPEGNVVARLQMVISCAFFPSLPLCIHDHAVGLSVAVPKIPI